MRTSTQVVVTIQTIMEAIDQKRKVYVWHLDNG